VVPRRLSGDPSGWNPVDADEESSREARFATSARIVCCLAVFPEHPRGHGALITHDGGFEGVERSRAQLFREPIQQGRIDQIPLRSIRQEAAASVDWLDQALDSDG
jgi:hypothetical protein